MIRRFVYFLWGGIFGAFAGFLLGIVLFPFMFPPPPGLERLTQSELRTSPAARATFVHVDPNDPLHWGKGKAAIYPNLVFLESDFEVGPGPAYRVLLMPKANVRSSAEVRDAMYVDLGPLRAFKGSQRYAIPAGVDLSKYPSLVIWCERFQVLISPADLIVAGAAAPAAAATPAAPPALRPAVTLPAAAAPAVTPAPAAPAVTPP